MADEYKIKLIRSHLIRCGVNQGKLAFTPDQDLPDLIARTPEFKWNEAAMKSKLTREQLYFWFQGTFKRRN